MKIKQIFINFLPIFILSFISFLALKEIFHPGIYTAHDIWHNLARINYYFQSLKDGQFPPYFVSSLAYGFGYPLFLFSYHLPWLFGSLLMSFGVGDVSAIKIIFLLGFFISGVSMYFLALEISGNKFISLASSILYLWAPYRFFIIFVSAAVGISLTFTFVPIVFLGLIKIYKGEFNGLLLTTIGLVGIVLSHFPTLIVFMPLFFAFGFYLFIQSSSKDIFLKYIIFSILLSLGLSAFYLFPALYYKNLILGLPSVFSMGFITLKQLFYSKWGFGIIVRSAAEDPFSFQIGIAQWFILITALLFLFYFRRKIKDFYLVFILILVFGFNIFLSTSFSQIIWQKFLSKTGLDFPFRFIYPNVFIASLIFVYFIKDIKNKLVYYFLPFILLFFAFYTNRNHIRPNMFLSEEEFRPFVKSETTTSTYNEYFPAFADQSLLNSDSSEKIMKQNNLSLVYQNTTKAIYKISIDDSKDIVLPNYAYPFLSVRVDGFPYNFKTGQGGLITLFISKDSEQIEIEFRKTFIMKLSILMTVVSLFVFLLILCKNLIISKYYEK